MCVCVCVGCLTLSLPVPHTDSLARQTCMLVHCVSLGMAQIWQQLGIHPMQETHPTLKQLAGPPLCALRVQTSGFYANLYSHILNLRIYTLVTAVTYRLPGTVKDQCRGALLPMTPELYFLVNLTLFSSPLCHSYWFCPFHVSAARVPTSSATKCCRNGFFSEMCTRRAACKVQPRT